MAVPIEGYCVVAQKARIDHLLKNDSIEIPNATALADDDIWCCSFMAEADAQQFIESLEAFDLNVSQGPDSDVVLVHEFDRSVHPYCEWLTMGTWEKAVVGWKTGSRPESVVAREGWDPKIGSGLSFHDPASSDQLEFLRLEGNVEVYLNQETGEEVYIGRTYTPVEATFETASQTIGKYLTDAGQGPVDGEAAREVGEAVKMLDEVLAQVPDQWNVLWFHGKGQMALGNYELAYQSFHRAYELEKDVELIPRELAGMCLELGKFDEAVRVAEQAVALDPRNSALIGNLAVAHLLAGRIEEANKSIAAAMKIDQNDQINRDLHQIITDVADGKRPRPTSLVELTSMPPKPKKRLWEFWKS